MPKKQLEAYQSVEKATLSGRALEASVLDRAAMLLQSCTAPVKKELRIH